MAASPFTEETGRRTSPTVTQVVGTSQRETPRRTQRTRSNQQPPSQQPKGRLGRVVVGSLTSGLLAAGVLAAMPFIPAEPSELTGAVLCGFALGLGDAGCPLGPLHRPTPAMGVGSGRGHGPRWAEPHRLRFRRARRSRLGVAAGRARTLRSGCWRASDETWAAGSGAGSSTRWSCFSQSSRSEPALKRFSPERHRTTRCRASWSTWEDTAYTCTAPAPAAPPSCSSRAPACRPQRWAG